jgi:hypothetical protein
MMLLYSYIILDISHITVQKALADMMSNNEIIKIGGGRYTSYAWNWERE